MVRCSFGIVIEKNIRIGKALLFAGEKKYCRSPDIANPEHYAADDENSRGYNYKEYVSVIDKFSNNYFDLFWLMVVPVRPASHIAFLNKKGWLFDSR